MNNKALSLVELLIATAVLLLILSLLGRGLMSSSSTVDTVITEAHLLADTRSAGQIISESLSRAVYIYPPGKKILLNTPGSWTVENPNGNKNNWISIKDSMLAFIEAPEKMGKCSKSNNKACLYFVAYYPVKRKTVVSRAVYGRALKDINNPAARVLFEYRKRLDFNSLDEIHQPPLRVNGSSGKLLADFIAEKDGFRIDNIVCRNPDGSKLCKMNAEPNYLETISTGEFVLKTAYRRKNGISTGPEMVFNITPRNLY